MMGNENSDITADEAALQEEGEQMEAYMFQNQFFREGEFHVVSGELENVPNPAGVGEGGLLSSFNTRIIQYTNAKNTFAYFFPYQDAEVEQGVLYRLGGDWSDINQNGGGDGGGETPRSNLINVTFQQVGTPEDF
ncbi:hypothetical protein M0R89_06995 [Halorussus limi]|uniref:Uncharacterized protein n=1 Tax=Halorussus limi TaxID=2938695 RepID=A0A8U0HY84_9EURY|nr:hypothetical protein [Halorussus limi]UPV75799.1 hypothetical protein M0R89_06995 [Halorussus limi]